MRGPAGGGAAPAWALMELQGELVVKANAGAAARGLSRQEAQAHPGLEIGALDVRGGARRRAWWWGRTSSLGSGRNCSGR